MTDTNSYFDTDNYSTLARLTLARAEEVNAIVASIVAGFDLVPSKERVYQGRITYCGQAAGSLNAETVTAPYTIALTDGLWLRYRPNTTNTGALTINPSSLGIIAVRNYAGAALSGGEAVSGTVVDIVYIASSNHFRIINPLVAVAAVTAFDINGQTAETAIDPDADFIPVYDTSAGAVRKALPRDVLSEYTIMLKSQMFAGA